MDRPLWFLSILTVALASACAATSVRAVLNPGQRLLKKGVGWGQSPQPTPFFKLFRLRNSLLFLLSTVFLAACSAPAPEATPTPPQPAVTPIPAPTASATSVSEPPAIPLDLSDVGVITPTLPINQVTLFGYTHQKPNGNRLAVGAGAMNAVLPIDIRLEGEPAWVVGVPIDGGGTVWAAVLSDGRVQSFMILAETITPISLGVDRLPPGMPPLLVVHEGVPRLVTVRAGDASPLTHPVLIGDGLDDLAYVADNGDLVVIKDGETHRFAVDALPDARILQDPLGRLLVMTGASSRYAHGVLGDQIEGTSLTLVETEPEVAIVNTISTGIQVFEGAIPIWCDLDDDGDWEIVTTLSDAVDGARIVLFNEAGERIAEGPSAERGYRWRHQLVAAPFGGGTEMFLADNLTPHLGGVTEFYRWDEEAGLVVVSSIGGYSTHTLGSRNLDRAITGDLDGDGLLELLVPGQSGDVLGAFRLQEGAATLVWNLGLGAELTTNLAGVTMLDGGLAVGFGLASGILRLYIP